VYKIRGGISQHFFWDLHCRSFFLGPAPLLFFLGPALSLLFLRPALSLFFLGPAPSFLFGTYIVIWRIFFVVFPSNIRLAETVKSESVPKLLTISEIVRSEIVRSAIVRSAIVKLEIGPQLRLKRSSSRKFSPQITYGRGDRQVGNRQVRSEFGNRQITSITTLVVVNFQKCLNLHKCLLVADD